MIKGVIFDFDNTLMDFMKMKRAAVEAAVEAMIDAGLLLQKAEMVATSTAVTLAVEYNLKRIAAPVKAANPRVCPKE